MVTTAPGGSLQSSSSTHIAESTTVLVPSPTFAVSSGAEDIGKQAMTSVLLLDTQLLCYTSLQFQGLWQQEAS